MTDLQRSSAATVRQKPQTGSTGSMTDLVTAGVLQGTAITMSPV